MSKQNKEINGLYFVISVFLLTFGCAGDVILDSESALGEGGPECAILDFDTDGVGDPIPAGAVVEQAYAALGVTIDVWWYWEGSKCEGLGVAFDSDNPTGGDTDLGYSGLGNLLINHEYPSAEEIANDFVEEPDDHACGALFELWLDEPMCVKGMTLLDIDLDEDPVEIALYDGDGDLIALHFVDPVGDNGRVDVSLPVTPACDVVFATILLSSSGAVDNIELCSSAPEPEVWTRVYDGGRDDVGSAVAVDSDQSVIVAGSAANASDLDGVVRKYDSAGTLLWSAVIDNGAGDSAEGVATDSATDIIVVGRSDGADRDLFVRKYSSDGSELWSRIFDGGGVDVAYAVAVDGDDDILVAGTTTVGAGQDMFLRKYDADGNTVWTRSVDVGANDVGFGVAVDGDDNVFLAGRSDNGSDYDLWLRKYDDAGNELWTRLYDGGGDDAAYAVAVDGTGSAVVAGGAFNGVNSDIIVRKFDGGGATVWTHAYDGGGIDVGRGVAIDGSGNVVVNGDSTAATQDGWTRKLDPSGAEIRTEIFDRGGVDGGNGVAIDIGGAIIATGYFDNGSDNDMWLAKYRP